MSTLEKRDGIPVQYTAPTFVKFSSNVGDIKLGCYYLPPGAHLIKTGRFFLSLPQRFFRRGRSAVHLTFHFQEDQR